MSPPRSLPSTPALFLFQGDDWATLDTSRRGLVNSGRRGIWQRPLRAIRDLSESLFGQAKTGPIQLDDVTREAFAGPTAASPSGHLRDFEDEWADLALLFRKSLLALLAVNIVYYTFETITTIDLFPSSHDTIILLLGFMSQDQKSLAGLKLYNRLSLMSVAFDLVGRISAYSYDDWWIALNLVIVFVVETTLKVFSMRVSRLLMKSIVAQRQVDGVLIR
ncbi:uncharacterized protein BJ171DRAFT_520384 [Polychytrium aggregatum]|uniref:uncharacterized protein n=1 Tax=Polychytrium aggregatum TaxID=110093 RepID=UPI0022FDF65C|nr:uncharacterized protein BJ171DRAFT_520384 [Polychytrium aggregatum]KAI9197255.1 hypothetical protein BJ171DRAFT_520384 [Polychytrium aggregatum]